MRHHTKDKGDKGLGFVIADLLRFGIQPALLLSEHLPFDCVAIAEDGRLCRLSVKYRTAKGGRIPVSLKSSWADSHGTHTKHPDLTKIDAVAVFCPDTLKVYYVTVSEVSSTGFTLRVSLPKNNQMSKVKMADEYCDPNRIFAPVA